MKRAFFKLGNIIRVQSATAAEGFRVDINVKKWKDLGDKNWDFRFADHGPLRQRRYPPRTTKINVAQLHEAVVSRVNEPTFMKSLRERIASTYGLFLSAGLGITVNGVAVKPDLPSIGGYGEKLAAARRRFRTDSIDTLIIAGVTSRDDRRPHGWYVFCNGRMVLQADRSRVTGWGENLPQWHSKYQHFAGYVYFHSSDVRNLPWTTTKQNVVAESAVYQSALGEMQVQARPVLNFLNNLYPDDLVEDQVEERQLLSRARSISLTDLPRKETPFTGAVAPRAREDDAVTIVYKKPKKLVNRVRQQLGYTRLSAGAVGSHTFDYYVKQELG